MDLFLGTGSLGAAEGDVLLRMENLFGSRHADAVRGDAGANRLDGGGGVDRLEGRDGHDTLLGGDGDDLLDGGLGRDTLTGGAGADRFVWSTVQESPGFAHDVIRDFAGGDGDRIDLSAFGASFVGTADLPQGGEAAVNWRIDRSGQVLVQLDADGNGSVDLAIQLRGIATVAEGDFIL